MFLEQDVSPQGCLLFPRMQFQRWDMGGYGGLLFTVHWYCASCVCEVSDLGVTDRR